jgi:uncharacterized protein (TIGR03000 family)
MNRSNIYALLAVSVLFVGAGHALAYGRGGGGRGGYRGGAAAGGYRGGAAASGYRGGYAAGGYRGGAAAGGYRGGYSGGGYRAGGAEVYRGVPTGAYGRWIVGGSGGVPMGAYGRWLVGADGGARIGASGGARTGAVGRSGDHAAVATDFGFGHVAAAAGGRGYVAAGHSTRGYSGGVLAARGTAVRGEFHHHGAFNSAWWRAHRGAWQPFGWNAALAWGWADWAALTSWFGVSAPPVYYDYGNTIVYTGDQVYVDGQPGPTAAVYYQEAADLAQSAPPAAPKENKDEAWKPLGIFALVQGDQSDPSAVFQLAVNKTGIIRGNYYNVFTDTTLPVRGAVDKKTQRASWIVGDQKTTVYDTGIYNLTKEESPLLIHFGKERTQEWLLVRVEEKDAQAPPAEKEVETPAPVDGEGIARVTVVVPADAEVFFDGTATTLTGTERTFHTPPLKEGSSFYYTVRARWTEDGKPVEQTRKVVVKAGDQLRVAFPSP